jgi:hypothetical protein
MMDCAARDSLPGILLEQLDGCTVESYPRELDELDFSELCARYEDAKVRLLSSYRHKPLQAARATRKYLETRAALRAKLELIWPDR